MNTSITEKNITRFLEAFDSLSTVFSSMGSFAGKISLSKPELLIIDYLARQDELTMSQLAKTLNIGLSTATGVVDRLVGKKLVGRIRDKEDRRLVKIALTKKGQELGRSYQEQKKQIFGKLIGTLSTKEQGVLISFFEKIADSLKEPNP